MYSNLAAILIIYKWKKKKKEEQESKHGENGTQAEIHLYVMITSPVTLTTMSRRQPAPQPSNIRSLLSPNICKYCHHPERHYSPLCREVGGSSCCSTTRQRIISLPKSQWCAKCTRQVTWPLLPCNTTHPRVLSTTTWGGGVYVFKLEQTRFRWACSVKVTLKSLVLFCCFRNQII